MCELVLTEEQSREIQHDLDMSNFFEKEFSMMNRKLCENKLMSSIIDKFGADVKTEIVNANHFKVIAEISLSDNFYGWVFASGGSMQITSPAWVRDEFHGIVTTYARY